MSKFLILFSTFKHIRQRINTALSFAFIPQRRAIKLKHIRNSEYWWFIPKFQYNMIKTILKDTKEQNFLSVAFLSGSPQYLDQISLKEGPTELPRFHCNLIEYIQKFVPRCSHSENWQKTLYGYKRPTTSIYFPCVPSNTAY